MTPVEYTVAGAAKSANERRKRTLRLHEKPGGPQSDNRAMSLMDYGPYTTLYNCRRRREDTGVFLQSMKGLAAASAEPNTV
jgi:hypothetical protein